MSTDAEYLAGLEVLIRAYSRNEQRGHFRVAYVPEAGSGPVGWLRATLLHEGTEQVLPNTSFQVSVMRAHPAPQYDPSVWATGLPRLYAYVRERVAARAVDLEQALGATPPPPEEASS